MSQSENRLLEVLGVLAAAYPNSNVQAETVTVFREMLGDIDPDLLEQAAKAYIATEKFFPSVSELRGKVTALIERACETPSATEAWGEVVDKMRTVGNTVDFGGYQPDCFSSPIIARVVSYLGWNEICLSDNQVADRARFIQAYEVELNRAREDMKLLPETHDAIARMNANRAADGIKQLTSRMTMPRLGLSAGGKV
jgi:hypothetical protein